jgi:hypothetical protein
MGEAQLRSRESCLLFRGLNGVDIGFGAARNQVSMLRGMATTTLDLEGYIQLCRCQDGTTERETLKGETRRI